MILPSLLQKKDEFRVAGIHLLGARHGTIEEVEGSEPLIESIVKGFFGNGELAVRPNFGLETLMLSFPRMGKNWNINQVAPTIKGNAKDAGKMVSWSKRFNVLEMGSSYVNDHSDVNCDSRVFEDIPDIETFVAGEEARYIRVMHHLLPYKQKYTEAQCFGRVKHPP